MSEEPKPMPDKAEIDRRKREIKDTRCCPYCGERMKRWEVPQTMFTTWPNAYMYICFNDECPYMINNYEAMARIGNEGTYRVMYDPALDCCQPIPVLHKQALREGIVPDEDEEPVPEVSRENILGKWQLVSSKFVDGQGQAHYPLGDDLQGMLSYAEDGSMSVQTMPADGTLYQTPDGRVIALETMGAYNGTFQLHSGNQITHHIENSMFPDWNNRNQERGIDIEKQRLVLTSPTILVAGREETVYMIYRRAE